MPRLQDEDILSVIRDRKAFNSLDYSEMREALVTYLEAAKRDAGWIEDIIPADPPGGEREEDLRQVMITIRDSLVPDEEEGEPRDESASARQRASRAMRELGTFKRCREAVAELADDMVFQDAVRSASGWVELSEFAEAIGEDAELLFAQHRNALRQSDGEAILPLVSLW